MEDHFIAWRLKGIINTSLYLSAFNVVFGHVNSQIGKI